MIHPIVRMYASAQQASDAVQKLRGWGFTDSEITLVTPTPGKSVDAVASIIMAGYVLKPQALVYASGVVAGHSVVIVRAPFGTGGNATEILDEFAPIDPGLPLAEDPALLWNEATPFSSALWIPVRSNNPTPFSNFFSLPVLTHSKRSGSLSISSSSKPTTAGLGLPLLSSKATPFSSLFGLPTLKNSR